MDCEVSSRCWAAYDLRTGLKTTSVLVAGIAWFLVSFEAESVQTTFVVPVECRNLPDTMDIDETTPTEVRLTLTGFERAFNLLVPNAPWE